MDKTPLGNDVIDFHPLKLPNDLMAAVGRVIAAGAQAEAILAMAIAGLSQMEGLASHAVTTHMPIPLKFSALRALGSLYFPDLQRAQELEDLLLAIEKAQQPRNSYAHGKFGVRNGELLFTSFHARTHFETRVTPVTVHQVEREAVALFDAGIKLMEFLIANDLLAPIQERDRPIITPRDRRKNRKKSA